MARSTDVVDKALRCADELTGYGWEDVRDTLLEIAAEVERLRAENAGLDVRNAHLHAEVNRLLYGVQPGRNDP